MELSIYVAGNLAKIITGCPDEYKEMCIDISENLRVEKVKKDGTTESVPITERYAINYIDEFLTNQQPLDRSTWFIFNKYLGFIPFWKRVSTDSYEYVNTPASCLGIEELKKLAKPKECKELFGISIPTALINRMQTIVGWQDTYKELPQDLEEFAHPPELTDYIKPALIKLATIERARYTLADMAVFNFLDVLSIFKEKTWFINGDELIEFNPINLLNAGQIDGVRTLLFTFRYSENKFEHDNPLLTDTIIETMQMYKCADDIYQRWGKCGLRAMKIILTRYDH